MSSQSVLGESVHSAAAVAPTGPPRRKGEPMGRSISASLSSRWGRAVVYGVVLLWTVPTFGVFVSSFRRDKAVKSSGWWTAFSNPDFIIGNYKSVLSSKNGGNNDLLHYWFNSMRISVPSTVISVGIAALAAYAFSWMEFKGRDWLFTAVVSLLVVPLQLSLVPLLRLTNTGWHLGSVTIIPDLHLTNNVTGIWLAHSCFGMPFCVFLLKNFMSALPKELIEAARVDGASHLTIFGKLVLPLSKPAIASLCIFQFVFIFNDFLIGKVFGGTKNEPIVSRLVGVAGSLGQSWHLLTAAAFISMVTPLAVFFALQKHFVRGLLAGAVKG